MVCGFNIKPPPPPTHTHTRARDHTYVHILYWILIPLLYVPAIYHHQICINTMTPQSNYKIDQISNEIALGRIPQNPTGGKSTLVQVLARCREAASHYLDQCSSTYVAYFVTYLRAQASLSLTAIMYTSTEIRAWINDTIHARFEMKLLIHALTSNLRKPLWKLVRGCNYIPQKTITVIAYPWNMSNRG